MVPSSNTKPGRLLVHCAAAFALALALPAYADDGDREERSDKTEPFPIEFDNPCTPDHLSGQGQIRQEQRTTTKKNGVTEIRERSRLTGNPIGTPSLAIYEFRSDNHSFTRTSATTFKMTEHRRHQGIPDRKVGATGLPVQAFFVTSHQDIFFGPHQNKNKVDSDTKCRDRQGREMHHDD